MSRWIVVQTLGSTETTHIFKPSLGKLPNGIDLTYSAENEYFCLKTIAALGIEMSEDATLSSGGGSVRARDRCTPWLEFLFVRNIGSRPP